jgi:AcrR family transcriptional regulator
MKKNSKDAIVAAAISLFNTNGFTGTSIRDIAAKAKVNAANIAYYFHNKHGLLEHCFTEFFEGYIAEIEKGFSYLHLGAAAALKIISENILMYHSRNIHLTRFILREVSLDSQVVREIMSTYLMKEKYYLNKIFEIGMRAKEFRSQHPSYLIIQFKGLLSMPFLNMQYVSEVLHVFPNERYFADKYLIEIYNWIDGAVREHAAREIVLAN